MVDREEILNYVKDKYNTKPEYLWKNFPEYAVLRHKSNNKWYGLLAVVSGEKIGLKEGVKYQILDIKCEEEMTAILSKQEGFRPGYHMNKNYWLTVILDGTVEDDVILSLIDTSYKITKK